MVGLDFDDRSSDVIDEQGRSDQVRCNLMNAAGKKALESIARQWIGNIRNSCCRFRNNSQASDVIG